MGVMTTNFWPYSVFWTLQRLVRHVIQVNIYNFKGIIKTDQEMKATLLAKLGKSLILPLASAHQKTESCNYDCQDSLASSGTFWVMLENHYSGDLKYTQV